MLGEGAFEADSRDMLIEVAVCSPLVNSDFFGYKIVLLVRLEIGG